MTDATGSSDYPRPATVEGLNGGPMVMFVGRTRRGKTRRDAKTHRLVWLDEFAGIEATPTRLLSAGTGSAHVAAKRRAIEKKEQNNG